MCKCNIPNQMIFNVLFIFRYLYIIILKMGKMKDNSILKWSLNNNKNSTKGKLINFKDKGNLKVKNRLKITLAYSYRF